MHPMGDMAELQVHRLGEKVKSMQLEIDALREQIYQIHDAVERDCCPRRARPKAIRMTLSQSLDLLAKYSHDPQPAS